MTLKEIDLLLWQNLGSQRKGVRKLNRYWYQRLIECKPAMTWTPIQWPDITRSFRSIS